MTAASLKPLPLGAPANLGRRMTAEEQAQDKKRQESELQRAFDASELDRNRAALQAMRVDREKIERGQPTSMTQEEWQERIRGARNPHKAKSPSTETSEWTKSPYGGYIRDPINASTKRDALGNPVNRYGVPRKK